jgi:competence protein ComEC
VRRDDGRLTAVAVRGGMFELARWLEYDGDKRTAKDVAAAEGFSCDALGCAIRTRGHEIAILSNPAALRDHCATASVIVVRFLATRACAGTSQPPQLIDPASVRNGDGHLLSFTADGIVMRTVADFRGQRPWTRAGILADTTRDDTSRYDTRPPRETNVPFATTPPDGPPEPDDDGRSARGVIP